MTFEIMQTSVMIHTAQYVTWFRSTVNRDDVIKHVREYRDLLDQLDHLRSKDVPMNAHWVPARMEGCYTQLMYIQDRLDQIFTYTPENLGFDGYQFPWMELIVEDLINKHTQTEKEIQWVEPGLPIKKEDEKAKVFDREWYVRRDYARDVIYERSKEHSRLRGIARRHYAKSNKIKEQLAGLEDMFGEIDPNENQYVANLMGKQKNIEKKAAYHYAMAANYFEKQLKPCLKRYAELFPAEPRPSNMALNMDAKRESERETWFDPFFKEREMPGHRVYVCPVCCEDDRNHGTQYTESSYVEATCFNQSCSNYGEQLMQAEEYERMMGDETFRTEIVALQEEYNHTNTLRYLNYLSNKEMVKFDRVQAWNRTDNMLKRAYARMEAEKEEEYDLIADLKAA